MAIEAFPNFKSFETHHCVTGSLLHVYRFNRIPISEECCLGLVQAWASCIGIKKELILLLVDALTLNAPMKRV